MASQDLKTLMHDYPSIPQQRLKVMMRKNSVTADYKEENELLLTENTGYIENTFSFKAVQLKIVLVGKAGSGKSSVGNLLLGNSAFPVQASSIPSTEVIEECGVVECEDLPPMHLRIIKTPGVYSSGEECIKILNQVNGKFGNRVNVILLVHNLGQKIYSTDLKATKRFMASGGDDILDRTMIVFTHGNSLADDEDLKSDLESFKDPSKSALIELCNEMLDGRKFAVENVEIRGVEKLQQQALLRKIHDLFVHRSCRLMKKDVSPHPFSSEFFRAFGAEIKAVPLKARPLSECSTSCLKPSKLKHNETIS